MELVLEISKHILVIGGALCVLIVFVILLYFVSILSVVRGLMMKVRGKFDFIEQMMMLPVLFVHKLLENDTDDEE